VLDTFDTIQVATSYRLNEVTIDYLPAREDLLAQVLPELTEIQGWNQDISGSRSPDELPTNARRYVDFLQEQVGAPITMVGVGPGREQLVPLSAHAAVLVTS
jgi:adenylosuccinate synthase